MTKTKDIKSDTPVETKPAKTKPSDNVYETSETVTQHDPYDTKVGGKPVSTLADGTVPETVKPVASKAE